MDADSECRDAYAQEYGKRRNVILEANVVQRGLRSGGWYAHMALEVATRYELFPAHPRSAALARDRVGALLAQWGLGDLAGAAELVTAELISNAVKVSEPGGQVGLGVYRSGDAVVVEVWDGERRPPRLLDPGPDDIGGRGLMLVGVLTRRWGYRWPVTGGKVVYAVVDAPM